MKIHSDGFPTVINFALDLANITVDDISVNGNVTYTTGEAITAGSYQIQRDTDGTNQLHLNVPTGAGYEWSINDVTLATMSTASGLTVAGLIRSGASGSLSGGTFVSWDQGTNGYSFGRDNQSTGDFLVTVSTTGAAGTVLLRMTSAAVTTMYGLTSITPSASTSGVPTTFTVTGPAHTGLTAATEDIGNNLNFSATKTWASGAGPLAVQREILIQAPTYSGNVSAALTITDAYTEFISGAPITGTNLTITRSHALGVKGGITHVDSTTARESVRTFASSTVSTATIGALTSVTLDDNRVYQFRVKAIAQTADNVDKVVFEKVAAAYRQSAGAATLLGVSSIVFSGASTNLFSCAFSATGNTIELVQSSLVGSNVTWAGTLGYVVL